MKKQTICTAAIEALRKNGKSMTASAIHDSIVQNDLYQFKAKDPLSILKSELRKHTEGVTLPVKKGISYFKIQEDGTYWLAK